MKNFSRMIAVVLVLFVMGISFTGCPGSYALSKKIGSAGDKIVGGLLHFILCVIPVIPIGDMLILNTIEFWTGSNLIGAGNTLEQIDENGNALIATKNDNGTLSLKVIEISGKTSEYLLEKRNNDFNIYDADGVLLSSNYIDYESLVN